MLTNWLNSLYKYQGYLGTDQKHKNVTYLGRNQVITNPIIEYKATLLKYEEGLSQKYTVTLEMQEALNDLGNSSTDPEVHIDIWARSLHLFPDKWKPPLRLDKTFDESNLKPEIVEKIREGEYEIKRISDELYTLNISEETGSLPENALDIFEGSFLQDLLK